MGAIPVSLPKPPGRPKTAREAELQRGQEDVAAMNLAAMREFGGFCDGETEQQGAVRIELTADERPFLRSMRKAIRTVERLRGSGSTGKR